VSTLIKNFLILLKTFYFVRHCKRSAKTIHRTTQDGFLHPLDNNRRAKLQIFHNMQIKNNKFFPKKIDIQKPIENQLSANAYAKV